MGETAAKHCMKKIEVEMQIQGLLNGLNRGATEHALSPCSCSCTLFLASITA